MQRRRILHYSASLQIDSGKKFHNSPKIGIAGLGFKNRATAADAKTRRICGQLIMKNKVIDIGKGPRQEKPPLGNANDDTVFMVGRGGHHVGVILLEQRHHFQQFQRVIGAVGVDGTYDFGFCGHYPAY